MKKRLLPALLALVMVLGMLPMAVFAAPEEEAPEVRIANPNLTVYENYDPATYADGAWDSASISATDGDSNTVNVTVTVTNLQKHAGGAGGSTPGYWLGVAIPKENEVTYYQGWGETANTTGDGVAEPDGTANYGDKDWAGFYWDLSSKTTGDKGYLAVKKSETVTTYVITFNFTKAPVVATFSAVASGTLYGKSVSDIQGNAVTFTVAAGNTATAKTVTISGDKQLKYITGWTEFNGAVEAQQQGYYAAVSVPKTVDGAEVTKMVLKSVAADGTETDKVYGEGGTALSSVFNDAGNSACYLVLWLNDNGTRQPSIQLEYGDTQLVTYTFAAGTGVLADKPAVGDVIGTVTDDTLKPEASAVTSTVTEQAEDGTAETVDITVVPAEGVGATNKTEVPLSTDALTALEEVTKPVVISTPQGSVKVAADVLIDEIGTENAVKFVMDNTDTTASVETYDVKFVDASTQDEVEVKDLPTNAITLTFMTSFSEGDEVIVRSGETLLGTTVAEGGLVTVQTTHLSEWTITKKATANVTYVPKDSLTGTDTKYFYGKLTISGLADDHYYLVALTSNNVVSGGLIANVCQVLQPSSSSIVIPCQSGLNLKLYDITKDDDFEIPATFTPEQIIIGGLGVRVDTYPAS